ncbi:MAG: glucokinase [Pararhodobacter sp.]
MPPASLTGISIVADIGGTHSRLGQVRAGRLLAQGQRCYRNAAFPGPEALLATYRQDTGHGAVDALCLAVAGPVRGDQAHMTNLGWLIDANRLGRQTGAARVQLLNDLQAQGHALPTLPDDAVCTLRKGQPAPATATRLVLGIGTGLNAAPVHGDGARIIVPASECGHATLPQHTDPQRALARELARRHGRATIEEALSGRGLVALHGFLGGRAANPAAIVAALDAGEADARATGAFYAGLLGAVLADLALVHLPYGGIYLIGGLARELAPHLGALGLEAAYRRPGERYDDILAAIGLHIIQDDTAGLLGCAAALGQR